MSLRDAHNVHLRAMTEHKEFSADSGFNCYYQISYKTLELHISSYKSSFTDIMETRYSRTHLFAIMFFVLKRSTWKQENYYGNP
jgi:hypothetical protein